MKTEDEIRQKIEELEEIEDGIDDEFEEALQDEDLEEDSEQGKELRAEFDLKEKVTKEQIKLLEWILGE
ncbi:MAG: hypothetical protein PHH01_02140 [Patescibacteria group bacterium]|nr:hypothetical protein [Patescibacteria group bacterium]